MRVSDIEEFIHTHALNGLSVVKKEILDNRYTKKCLYVFLNVNNRLVYVAKFYSYQDDNPELRTLQILNFKKILLNDYARRIDDSQEVHRIVNLINDYF